MLPRKAKLIVGNSASEGKYSHFCYRCSKAQISTSQNERTSIDDDVVKWSDDDWKTDKSDKYEWTIARSSYRRSKTVLHIPDTRHVIIEETSWGSINIRLSQSEQSHPSAVVMPRTDDRGESPRMDKAYETVEREDKLLSIKGREISRSANGLEQGSWN